MVFPKKERKICVLLLNDRVICLMGLGGCFICGYNVVQREDQSL